MAEPSHLPHSMKMVFKHVVTTPLGSDPRTDWGKGIILGNTHEANRRDILQWGLADFNTGHLQHGTRLSAAEKCLLYCHYYLKYTFFACKRAFTDIRLSDLIRHEEQRIVLVDVGCGPGACCLAFSDSYADSEFIYIGIDSSKAMLKLAARILDEGQVQSLIVKNTKVALKNGWEDLKPGLIPRGARVLLVFSFFLGSRALSHKDVDHLARRIVQLTGSETRTRAVICYVNSPHPPALDNFQRMKSQLTNWTRLAPLTTTDLQYVNYHGAVGRQQVVYEIGFPGFRN